MSLQSYVRAVPKAELHVHLEGAIRPATLIELAAKNDVTLPADTVAGLESLIAYRDFAHFRELFIASCACLKTIDDYERAVYELGAELAGQNVRHAEVTFSAATHHVLGVAQETYFEGLRRGRARVAQDFGVQLAWIFNIVRSWPDPDRVAPLAEYTTRAAIEGREIGVIALGLAGPEADAAPEPFARWFDRARAAGLRSAPHAGEHAGPASVWGAIRALGAERIGHGVRAAEDPTLVTHLAEQQIPLDVCPHSNARLGVFSSLETHPLPRLAAAGVTVTVNSDDPALFGTMLSDDYAALVEPFGLTIEQIDAIVLAGFQGSFLPAERKVALVTEVRAELAALKREHLETEASPA